MYDNRVNLVVHSTEGNLVNALDNANPSRLLLHAIQNHPSVATQNISKELRLYLGTMKQEDSQHKVFLFQDGVAYSHSFIPQLDQLFHITSGDPSRGSIALDTDSAPPEGTLVQVRLMYLTQSATHQTCPALFCRPDVPFTSVSKP